MQDRQGAIVGTRLAAKYGWKLGDRITLRGTIYPGDWDYNVRAVGIEHEGFMNQQGWYTEAMYQASAPLARTIADRYGIKKDRAHIIGHYQVPDPNDPLPDPIRTIQDDGRKVATVKRCKCPQQRTRTMRKRA